MMNGLVVVFLASRRSFLADDRRASATWPLFADIISFGIQNYLNNICGSVQKTNFRP